VEPTLDRALGYPNDGRDLCLLHSLEVAKHNHSSDRLRNLAERRQEIGPTDPIVFVLTGWLRGRRFGQRLALLDSRRCRMSQAPATVARQIVSDGKEPWFETPFGIESSSRAESPKERLLKQIFSFRSITANTDEKSVKGVSIPFEKRPSCTVVAGKPEPGQLFIGASILTHHII
jgi:hypothetical protein